jgi:hypothetical protein
VIYLDFHLAQLQSFMTPHKLETLSSLSYIPAPGFFLLIPSPAVLSQLYLSSALDCSVDESSLHWEANHPTLFAPFFLARLQSTCNHLKVVLRIPSTEHLVEQLSFPVVTQTTLVFALTEFSLTVFWQWMLVIT